MADESHQSLARNLYDHCLGSGDPTGDLISRGKFPNNWVSQYRSLVNKVKNVWGDRPEWPREIVASTHFASWYLHLRYNVWKTGSGQRNEQTEKLPGAVRSSSELFLMSPASKIAVEVQQNEDALLDAPTE